MYAEQTAKMAISEPIAAGVAKDTKEQIIAKAVNEMNDTTKPKETIDAKVIIETQEMTSANRGNESNVPLETTNMKEKDDIPCLKWISAAEKLVVATIVESEYGAKQKEVESVLKQLAIHLDAKYTPSRSLIFLVQLPLIFNVHNEYYWAALSRIIPQVMPRLPFRYQLMFRDLLFAFKDHKEPGYQECLQEAQKVIAYYPKMGGQDRRLPVILAACYLRASDPGHLLKLEAIYQRNVAAWRCEDILELMHEVNKTGAELPVLMEACCESLFANVANIPRSHYAMALEYYQQFVCPYSTDLFLALDIPICNNMMDFTIPELVALLSLYSNAKCGSDTLFLGFDKRLGGLHKHLDIHCIPQILAAFANRGVYRKTLFDLFYPKLKGSLPLLTLDELSQVIASYTLVIPQADYFHTLCEPLLLAKMTMLSPKAMLRVVYAYTNLSPDLQFSPKLIQALEPAILSRLSDYPPSVLVRIAHIFHRAKRGSPEFFQKAFSRLVSDPHDFDPVGAFYLLGLACELKRTKTDILAAKQAILPHKAVFTPYEQTEILKYAQTNPALADVNFT
jgi:hypothetical protein